MKKKLIFVLLIAFCINVSAFAQAEAEYFINDKFEGVAPEGSYVSTPYLLQPNNVELVRNACNFEAIEWDRSTFESTDGKSNENCLTFNDVLVCGVSLRVGDNARVGDFADFGYAEFTIPAGTSVGEIRLHVRGKGNATAKNREAVISINGEDVETLTGMGSSFAKIFSQTINQIIDENMVIRVRSNNADPILINSIQVSLYNNGTGINTITQSAKLAAYCVKNVLNVTNIAEGVEQVNIYNLQGVLVSSTNLNRQTAVSISVSSLAQGIYLVKAGNETVKIQK